MKRTMYLLMLLFVTSTSLVSLNSCRDTNKSAGDQMEDAVDDTGDAIEEAVDDTGDAIDDATDDN